MIPYVADDRATTTAVGAPVLAARTSGSIPRKAISIPANRTRPQQSWIAITAATCPVDNKRFVRKYRSHHVVFLRLVHRGCCERESDAENRARQIGAQGDVRGYQRNTIQQVQAATWAPHQCLDHRAFTCNEHGSKYKKRPYHPNASNTLLLHPPQRSRPPPKNKLRSAQHA